MIPYPKIGFTTYEEIVKNSTVTNFYGFYQKQIDAGMVYPDKGLFKTFDKLIENNKERGITPVWQHIGKIPEKTFIRSDDAPKDGKSSTTETIKEEGEVMVNGEIIEATLLSSFFYSVNYLLDE
jgi:hypothetical protein